MPARDIRVLIADDEPAARRGVRQLIAAYPDFKVVGECRDGHEVLTCLDDLVPDVVFLDVAMPGVDGFEVIRRRTPERMPVVVFLTAFDAFAIRAFEAQAFDYLLKPVTEARFAATIKRLVGSVHSPARAPSPASDDDIAIATSRGILMVPIRTIDWIESADNYARVWVGGRSHLVRESLAALEHRLRRHGFVRAHRRALVSLAGVRRLIRTQTGAVVAGLECGARIRVSRRRRVAFAVALRSKACAWRAGQGAP